MCFPSIAIQVPQVRLVAIATRNRTCTGDVLNGVSLLLDYASDENWSLPPVLPRRDFLTKEACPDSESGQGGEMACRAVARKSR